jgi:hypothetical protein
MNRKHRRAVVDTSEEVVDLLLQALETEIGGADVYRTALKCVHNQKLREEWTRYLAQAEQHVRILQEACKSLGIDPELETPAREAVRSSGKALVQSMLIALGKDSCAGLDDVALDYVALAGSQDPWSWSLLGEIDEPRNRIGASERHDASSLDADSTSWSRTAWLPEVEADAVKPSRRKRSR